MIKKIINFINKNILLETLKTILYFSIFRYPLTLEEIHNYTNYSKITETSNELNGLIDQGILTQVDQYYVYGSDLDSVPKRLKGNIEAKKIMDKAKKRAKFISKFPFVEAVGLSGSLSKNYYDEKSDIDFFVIVKANRVWISKLFLMSYKKIFLFNSYKYFCVNYYISADHLEIEEKNRFTATELITIIPIIGKNVFSTFYKNNSWVKNYFSKFEPNVTNTELVKKPLFTKLIMLMIDNKIGNLIDELSKRIFLKRIQSKFRDLNENDLKIALKSTKNVSKHHPLNFQKKVISALNLKLDEVQTKFNVIIQKENV